MRACDPLTQEPPNPVPYVEIRCTICQRVWRLPPGSPDGAIAGCAHCSPPEPDILW
jgi:hypothetical protein